MVVNFKLLKKNYQLTFLLLLWVEEYGEKNIYIYEHIVL